ncbi:hypothetical protein LUZ62_032805 [Rhynchospora pubera]|uniref:Aminotransferase-like plant mobile domain-containing protein n=1 Tax=Rhynchospora pubera TaxID=906938 RepID=A0AAV8HUR7_9POAL|nr:hypothetical protein LUZ62_032805 [Rhynchospora pubera]
MTSWTWARSSKMRIFEPKNETIEQFLKDASSKGATKEDLYDLRVSMLADRDFSAGNIPRHEPTQFLPPDAPGSLFSDFDLFDELNAETFIHFPQRKPITHSGPRSGPAIRTRPLDGYGVQKHTVRVLTPVTSEMSHPPVRLPGIAMLNGSTHPWHPVTFLIEGIPGRKPGQTEWTQFCLKRYGGILKRARIFHPIVLSLFSFPRSAHLFRAFISNWNFVTNTLFVEDRMMTILLEQLEQLSGIPILGRPYEEYSPVDSDLFGVNLDGSWRHFSSVRNLYEVYERLFRLRQKKRSKKGVSFETWIEYFTDGVTPSSERASLLDPLGIGKDTIAFSGTPPPLSDLTSLPLDDETILAAFLSFWLCYFVFPRRPIGMIRPEVFVMAGFMARGEVMALGGPVLANLFRSLRLVASSPDPSFVPAVVPFHFLFGWIRAYWPSTFLPPAMPESLRDAMPFMADIADVSCDECIDVLKAHSWFTRSRAVINPFPRSRTFCRDLPKYDSYFVMRDDPYSETGDLSILAQSHRWAEYMIGLRAGLLPYRTGDDLYAEPYFPSLVAHQLGYDQFVPRMIFPRVRSDLDCNLLMHALIWKSFQRLGTGARFWIPSATRIGIITIRFYVWYMGMVEAYHERRGEEIVRRLYPTYGERARYYDDPPWGPRIPSDFRGLDGHIRYFTPDEVAIIMRDGLCGFALERASTPYSSTVVEEAPDDPVLTRDNGFSSGPPLHDIGPTSSVGSTEPVFESHVDDSTDLPQESNLDSIFDDRDLDGYDVDSILIEGEPSSEILETVADTAPTTVDPPFEAIYVLPMDITLPVEPEVIEIPDDPVSAPPLSLDPPGVFLVNDVARLLWETAELCGETSLGRCSFDYGCFFYLGGTERDPILEQLANSSVIPLHHHLSFLTHSSVDREYSRHLRVLSSSTLERGHAESQVYALLGRQRDLPLRVAASRHQYDLMQASRASLAELNPVKIEMLRLEEELAEIPTQLEEAVAFMKATCSAHDKAMGAVKYVRIEIERHSKRSVELINEIYGVLHHLHRSFRASRRVVRSARDISFRSRSRPY